MLLDVNRLNRHMGEPEWSAAQYQAAHDILAGTEADLAGALYGAVIEPQERHELAAVDSGGGVDLTLPVFELIAVGGVVADGGIPPSGYHLQDRQLRRTDPGAGVIVPTTGLSFGVGEQRGYVDTVRVHYMGGWGAEPALVNAILTKAGNRMGDRHSDSARVSGVNATPDGPNVPWEWTEAELAPLGRYRNLGVGQR